MSRVDILIADDDEIIRLILHGLLMKLYPERTSSGTLRVRSAANGREAVDLAIEEPTDLILMDLHMPVLDGIAAFYELRDRLGPKCPNVYFISGYERGGERGRKVTRAIEDGAQGFINKPLTEEDLDQIVRACAFGSDDDQV